MRWAGAVLGTATLPISWWVFESIGKNVIPTEHHELVTAGFAATAKINFERWPIIFFWKFKGGEDFRVGITAVFTIAAPRNKHGG
jgi:hypothetical protein